MGLEYLFCFAIVVILSLIPFVTSNDDMSNSTKIILVNSLFLNYACIMCISIMHSRRSSMEEFLRSLTEESRKNKDD